VDGQERIAWRQVKEMAVMVWQAVNMVFLQSIEKLGCDDLRKKYYIFERVKMSDVYQRYTLKLGCINLILSHVYKLAASNFRQDVNCIKSTF